MANGRIGFLVAILWEKPDKKMKTTLQKEGEKATALLKDKVVYQVIRHRTNEVCIEFTDGTRLFIDTLTGTIDISIT
jgi:hypothetical protein